MKESPNVLVFGAGPVGATVGGWLTESYPNVWLLDQPPIAEALASKGLTLYLGGDKAHARKVSVRAVTRLADAPPADIVVIAVKTYSLDKVASLIREALGDAMVVVALQNGVDNQDILPKHFAKVVYGVVAYNAWTDEPGVVGYQKKGPLVLGTPDGRLFEETKWVAGILGRGVETVATERFQDAAWSKMIINLTNSLQALIGHPLRPIGHRGLFQTVLTNLTAEGVMIVKAAGHRECRLGGMPPWWLMRAAATLPQPLTRRAFDKNVEKMVMSSMAQDVLRRGGADSELESLNGRFIRMADEHRLAVPFNRTIYRLCKERFGKAGFEPMPIEDVWAEVQLGIARDAAR
jgi:2-dehydropantoate 2-reductase